ncbi:MAG: response regulator [Acidobacteriaceae bacterium]|nr:response regulator [Acidobacteriaceae bacterium]
MKVLLADDDEDQLLLRSMLLAERGFDTVKAPDCESAIRVARAERPDCAVIDLRFPTEELGLRTVRELKSLNPEIRVLVLTGGNSERVARRPEAALIDQIITKGRSSSELIQKLQSIRDDARD